MSDATADSTQPILKLLRPLAERIAALRPSERQSADEVAELEAAMNREFPVDGSAMRAVQQELARGIEGGWICNRGPENARFSRLAKPGAEFCGLSVDAVAMEGAAIDHTHPKGEVTIAFPAPGVSADACTFDGRAPGWVFLGPGSRHIPTVTGGRMQLIYFMPDGAVEWHMNE